MTSLPLKVQKHPAHALLGRLACFVQDVPTAAKYFQHALALAPTDLDIICHATDTAISQGLLDTAIAFLEFANARDPVNPARHTYLGFCYRCAGRFEEAISSYRTALRLSPEIISAQYNIGASRLLQGRFDEALNETLKEKVEGYRLKGSGPHLPRFGAEGKIGCGNG